MLKTDAFLEEIELLRAFSRHEEHVHQDHLKSTFSTLEAE